MEGIHQMKPELYTQVMLIRDIPESNLREGDTAMYIDDVPVTSGEDGAILEVFNVLGESVDVVTVPISAIAPLTPDMIPSVRHRIS